MLAVEVEPPQIVVAGLLHPVQRPAWAAMNCKCSRFVQYGVGEESGLLARSPSSGSSNPECGSQGGDCWEITRRAGVGRQGPPQMPACSRVSTDLPATRLLQVQVHRPLQKARACVGSASRAIGDYLGFAVGVGLDEGGRRGCSHDRISVFSLWHIASDSLTVHPCCHAEVLHVHALHISPNSEQRADTPACMDVSILSTTRGGHVRKQVPTRV